MKTCVAIVAAVIVLGTFPTGSSWTVSTKDFDPTRVRLKVLVLCDGSRSGGGAGLASSGPVNTTRAELIRAIGRHLKDGDAVRVASFGDRFLLSPSWVSGFSAIWQAFESVTQPSGEQSPVWDAIYSSVDGFEGTIDRRLIFLVSDGKASSNIHGFEEALDRVRTGNVVVYAANPAGANRRALQADQPGHPAARLKKIAEATAGEYAEPARRALPGFFGNVLRRVSASRAESQ